MTIPSTTLPDKNTVLFLDFLLFKLKKTRFDLNSTRQHSIVSVLMVSLFFLSTGNNWRDHPSCESIAIIVVSYIPSVVLCCADAESEEVVLCVLRWVIAIQLQYN